MVVNIPKEYRSNEALLGYFKALYGNDRVLHAEVVPDLQKVWEMREARDTFANFYRRARGTLGEWCNQ